MVVAEVVVVVVVGRLTRARVRARHYSAWQARKSINFASKAGECFPRCASVKCAHRAQVLFQQRTSLGTNLHISNALGASRRRVQHNTVLCALRTMHKNRKRTNLNLRATRIVAIDKHTVCSKYTRTHIPLSRNLISSATAATDLCVCVCVRETARRRKQCAPSEI